MKIDLFDAIVGLFVLMFAILVAIDVGLWIVRGIRSGSFLRRLRGTENEADQLPEANAGFSLSQGGRGAAASRHFARDKELGLNTHLGWGQRRNPPPDARD